MELHQKQTFDIVEREDGPALVMRDTPPWYGKVIFFHRNLDGSLTISGIIEEQGPSIAHGITKALPDSFELLDYENSRPKFWDD